MEYEKVKSAPVPGECDAARMEAYRQAWMIIGYCYGVLWTRNAQKKSLYDRITVVTMQALAEDHARTVWRYAKDKCNEGTEMKVAIELGMKFWHHQMYGTEGDGARRNARKLENKPKLLRLVAEHYVRRYDIEEKNGMAEYSSDPEGRRYLYYKEEVERLRKEYGMESVGDSILRKREGQRREETLRSVARVQLTAEAAHKVAARAGVAWLEFGEKVWYHDVLGMIRMARMVKKGDGKVHSIEQCLRMVWAALRKAKTTQGHLFDRECDVKGETAAFAEWAETMKATSGIVPLSEMYEKWIRNAASAALKNADDVRGNTKKRKAIKKAGGAQ